MTFDLELLALLACPVCQAGVRLGEDEQEIVCEGCGRRYPIEDGIPVMLADRATIPPAATESD